MSYPAKTERNAQILELHEKGIPLRAIGRRFGISYERVRQIIEQLKKK